jgi:hypothetical protein
MTATSTSQRDPWQQKCGLEGEMMQLDQQIASLSEPNRRSGSCLRAYLPDVSLFSFCINRASFC